MFAASASNRANTCEIHTGRLMEIRVAASYRSVQDVDDMIRMIGDHFAHPPPDGKVVIAADWRAVSLMSEATSERARQMLTGSNPRILRSSILVNPGDAIASLQVVRLVREAENDHRRHFTSPRAQFEWLAEVLTDQERDRLKVFLDLAED